LSKIKKKAIVYDDDPKVGQIWKMFDYSYREWQYFILIEADNNPIDVFDKYVFRMLCMNTSEDYWKFMNFELDEWRLVHET
jgi:hypothetical protein